MRRFFLVLTLLLVSGFEASGRTSDTVVLGMNAPKTGPYARQGEDEILGARLAVREINRDGGILGKPVQLAIKDSRSSPEYSREAVLDLIYMERARMIFGGVSSAVALRVSEICQERGVLFMGTLTAANAFTGASGRRHVFRACSDAWMNGKALGNYLKREFAGKRFFYVTADYAWGRSAEDSIRRFSETGDRSRHGGSLIPFPSTAAGPYKKAMKEALAARPDVLVLCLFGDDVARATTVLQKARGLRSFQIVVPCLEILLAQSAGPASMEGVIGVSDWNWKVPLVYGYRRGKQFVRDFVMRYRRYPGWGGCMAYTIVYEYKSAVERAGSFETPDLIRALEGHSFQLLKDRQTWREFDHQCVQTLYLVRGKPARMVIRDRFRMDFFEILEAIPGEGLVRSFEEWKAARHAAGKPPFLERFAGEKNPVAD